MLGGVIIINLLRRPDRLQNVAQSLSKSDLAAEQLYLLQAVDGSTLTKTDDIITDLAKKEMEYFRTHGHRLHHAQVHGPGVLGCYLSHMNAWKFVADQARKNNDLNVPYLILEDDVVFPKRCAVDMAEKYKLARSSISMDIPVILMYELTCLENCEMYSYFLVPGVFWGTRSYAINGHDAIKLLALPWLPIDGQIDAVMRRFRDEAKLSVLCYPLVNVSDKSGTDIQIEDVNGSSTMPFDRNII